MIEKRFMRGFWAIAGGILLLGGAQLPGSSAQARTAEEINRMVDNALERLYESAPGSKELVDQAKGVLVVPEVVEGAFFVGGQYGEGALQVNGSTTGYYSLAAGSFGFQFGGQKKDVILLFMKDEALQGFRSSKGWKVGVDGQVTLVKVGAGGSIDTSKVNKPILGFVVGRKGLMGGVSLQGSKITELSK